MAEEKQVVTNEKSYGFYNGRKSNTMKSMVLTIDAVLDATPGVFNQPEDLMNWIATNPYVRSVTLEEVE